MSIFQRIVYEPSNGMYREFNGINAFLEPADRSLYAKLLPKPFEMPQQPMVNIFAADYVVVKPWPLTRYQEWAVLLKCTWDGQEGWYVVTMPVTRWLANWGGRRLGFPKYITDAITLTQQGECWTAQGMYKGVVEIRMEFQPGLARPLAPWEEDIFANPSFFKGDAFQLVPPGQGPRAQRVRLTHVVPPQWSPEVGMVRIVAGEGQVWAGLLPGGVVFLGTYNHFRGGGNLVVD